MITVTMIILNSICSIYHSKIKFFVFIPLPLFKFSTLYSYLHTPGKGFSKFLIQNSVGVFCIIFIERDRKNKLNNILIWPGDHLYIKKLVFIKLFYCYCIFKDLLENTCISLNILIHVIKIFFIFVCFYWCLNFSSVIHCLYYSFR